MEVAILIWGLTVVLAWLLAKAFCAWLGYMSDKYPDPRKPRNK